jgi:hypothetical protein
MKVGVGTAIVSYMEPEPGYEREFNAWYERDHFIATVRAGPGVFASGRFVATRACKERRQGTFFGDPARGSYLSIAWVLPGKQPEWDEWVGREMETIAAEGRLFPHREHIHTGVYWMKSGGGSLPPEFVFDSAPAGLVAVAHAGADVFVEGAFETVTLRSARTIMSSVDPPEHELVLAFARDDPLTIYVHSPDALGFVSPFLATVPGTDTYTEEC